MKKTVQKNASSNPIEQLLQSIDWQKQIPVLVENLLKIGDTPQYQQDADVNYSDASDLSKYSTQFTNVNDQFTNVNTPERSLLTSQSQKQFELKLCKLYCSKRSLEEILEILEKEYNKYYTANDLYLAVDRACTNYKQWRSHGLDAVYPMIWVLPHRFKVIDDKGMYTSHMMYTLLSVDHEGFKDIIGSWIPKKESSNFWVSVLTELKNRGLSDIIFIAGKNIEGLQEAISAIYPQTSVIPNAALMLYNLSRCVLTRDIPKFSQDIRGLWSQNNIDTANEELTIFENNWRTTYPMVVNRIKNIWTDISSFYEVDNGIRQFIVSKDAFTKLYDAMRLSFAHKGFFPSDDAALKLAYLSANSLKKNWTAPILKWRNVNQSFSRVFGTRYPLL